MQAINIFKTGNSEPFRLPGSAARFSVGCASGSPLAKSPVAYVRKAFPAFRIQANGKLAKGPIHEGHANNQLAR
jgi:hypothetical protein